MNNPTIIYRHRKENLKKCTLEPLRGQEGFLFYTYPKEELPDLSGYVMLDIDAPPLTREDNQYGLFILDATWRYAGVMAKQMKNPPLLRRSIPPCYRTAYPRKQEDCPNPELGLASIEALYIAYHIFGWKKTELLRYYYWEKDFLTINPFI